MAESKWEKVKKHDLLPVDEVIVSIELFIKK